MTSKFTLIPFSTVPREALLIVMPELRGDPKSIFPQHWASLPSSENGSGELRSRYQAQLLKSNTKCNWAGLSLPHQAKFQKYHCNWSRKSKIGHLSLEQKLQTEGLRAKWDLQTHFIYSVLSRAEPRGSQFQFSSSTCKELGSYQSFHLVICI